MNEFGITEVELMGTQLMKMILVINDLLYIIWCKKTGQ